MAWVCADSIERVDGRLSVELQDLMVMQAAPCESAHDCSEGAVVVTEAADDEEFGVSGIAIE